MPSNIVIVVPKPDEFLMVRWAFGLPESLQPEVSGYAGEVYRAAIDDVQVSFVLMNNQNNVNSAVVTANAIALDNPAMVFLTGTALGNPDRTAVGSVIVATDAFSLVERNVYGDNTFRWRTRTVGQDHNDVSPAMRDYIGTSWDRHALENALYSMARDLHVMSDNEARQFLADAELAVEFEEVASGNDYFMSRPCLQSDKKVAGQGLG